MIFIHGDRPGPDDEKILLINTPIFRGDYHLTGKIFTQRIERNNLTLRTRLKRLARRSICFSRSVELHGKVISAFIEKYMFY